MPAVARTLAAILLALSALHVYWALGGRWGSSVTIPVINGRPSFQPGPAATLFVAALLAVAAAIVLARATWGVRAIALVFLLRAAGDFRLFGFFKRVTDTPFAHMDTWVYSPLCLLLAVLAAVLAFDK